MPLSLSLSAGFFFLGPFTPASDGESGSIFFYFVALLGMAFSDVVVDAMMVKQARAAGQKGGGKKKTHTPQEGCSLTDSHTPLTLISFHPLYVSFSLSLTHI